MLWTITGSIAWSHFNVFNASCDDTPHSSLYSSTHWNNPLFHNTEFNFCRFKMFTVKSLTLLRVKCIYKINEGLSFFFFKNQYCTVKKILFSTVYYKQ